MPMSLRVFSHTSGSVSANDSVERNEDPCFQQDETVVCHGIVIAMFDAQEVVGVGDAGKPLRVNRTTGATGKADYERRRLPKVR